MSLETERPINEAGLREVLIRQYALHEAPQWPRAETGTAGARVVVPRVHALTDIYKCLHQGEFGVGHLISSPEMFRELVTRELHRGGERPAEPLLENVDPDDEVRRLNLRPYGLFMAPELDRAIELLVEVCLASSQLNKGSTERFLETLSLFQKLNSHGELAVQGLSFIFPPALVADFLQHVREFLDEHGAIPVLSHSSTYRRLNLPSYRVVDLAVLRESALAYLLTGH